MGRLTTEMVRCVVRPEQIRQGTVTLDLHQTKHLAAVLRLGAGDEFVIVPGDGAPQVARLEAARGSRATALLLRPAPLPPPEPWSVTLAAAVPRHPAAFDQIVDQATQIGMATLIPMVTARSVARMDPSKGSPRHARWTQLAEHAAAQSGRATIPRLTAPMTWPAVLALRTDYDRLLLPTVGVPWRSVEEWVSPPSARRFLLLVGPEGDFTPEEIREATDAGAVQISLGYNVLRCETATLVVLTLLLNALRHRPLEEISPLP